MYTYILYKCIYKCIYKYIYMNIYTWIFIIYIYISAACAARNYGPHDLVPQKRRGLPDRETERQRDRQRHRLISSTGPHRGKNHREDGPPHWKCICIDFQCKGPAPRRIYSLLTIRYTRCAQGIGVYLIEQIYLILSTTNISTIPHT